MLTKILRLLGFRRRSPAIVVGRPIKRWGLLWHSRNRLDGERAHLIMENCQPALFRTRAAAREFAKQRYGYIANRPDLQAEPHGWRLPQPVRVEIGVTN